MVERWDWRGKLELDHRRSPVCFRSKEFRIHLKAGWGRREGDCPHIQPRGFTVPTWSQCTDFLKVYISQVKVILELGSQPALKLECFLTASILAIKP